MFAKLLIALFVVALALAMPAPDDDDYYRFGRVGGYYRPVQYSAPVVRRVYSAYKPVSYGFSGGFGGRYYDDDDDFFD